MKRCLKKNDIFSIRKSRTLYVVTQTAYVRGSGDDYLQGGHRVVARMILMNNTLGKEIEFYQTGSFNKMYLPKEIELYGKAKLVMSITDIDWI